MSNGINDECNAFALCGYKFYRIIVNIAAAALSLSLFLFFTQFFHSAAYKMLASMCIVERVQHLFCIVMDFFPKLLT